MSVERQTLGKSGEDLACAELARCGYEILARRYRRRGGEIDIIARHSATIVFLEVKTRHGRDFGDGADAVTPFKRRRIAAIALDFLARQQFTECPCRFDVFAIHFDAQGTPEITWFQNAFDVD